MSKKIKSTLELAMEKAAKIPALTEEEVRQRLEREYAPRGRVIAERFLAGDLAATRLDFELEEFRGEEGEIVRGAFLASMCQSIELEDPERAARVLEGVKLLMGDDRVEEASSRLRELIRDYQEERQREFAAVESAERELLRDLGVSGSAIRLNPRENERWRQRWSELQQAFHPKADEIKRKLTEHLISSLRERS